MKPLYLADKSAYARMHHTAVADRLTPLLVDGYVATCPIIDLEVLYSARSRSDYEDILVERGSLPSLPIDEAVSERAVAVQRLLAQRGQHRLPLPDLLIAAVAEINDLTVIHYDADYDRIASVTGQATEWVVPRGSV
ncbi:MAG: PIN domain nuclease [Acidimicrobiaceae bacterium]|nr:PIN domain nuclease [Acidimicrobiaceae bacterium]